MIQRSQCKTNSYIAPVKKGAGAEEMGRACIAWLAVQGMECANCAVRVHGSLLALDGVVAVKVDWKRGLVFVKYIPEKTNKQALALAVATTGTNGHDKYRAQPITFKEWVEWWINYR